MLKTQSGASPDRSWLPAMIVLPSVTDQLPTIPPPSPKLSLSLSAVLLAIVALFSVNVPFGA